VPVKMREWIGPALATPGFMLELQPPAQPHRCVAVECPIRFADGAYLVVVRPSSRPDFSVERAVWSYFFGVPLSLLLLGKLGEALRGFDDGIALFSRNNNRYASLPCGCIEHGCSIIAETMLVLSRNVGKPFRRGLSATLPPMRPSFRSRSTARYAANWSC
jgi:hypothetical protein